MELKEIKKQVEDYFNETPTDEVIKNLEESGFEFEDINKREQVIKAIADRIKAEYSKHPTLDWAYIAAKKIYYSYEIVKLNK